MPAYLWFLWSVAVYCAVVVLVAKSLQRRSDRGRGDLHDRALPELREVAVSNPRLAALLDEIERGQERGR